MTEAPVESEAEPTTEVMAGGMRVNTQTSDLRPNEMRVMVEQAVAASEEVASQVVTMDQAMRVVRGLVEAASTAIAADRAVHAEMLRRIGVLEAQVVVLKGRA